MNTEPIYKERRQRLYDLITAHPESFDLSTTFSNPHLISHPNVANILDHPCGAAGCFGGWVNVIRAHDMHFGQAPLGNQPEGDESYDSSETSWKADGTILFNLCDLNIAAEYIGLTIDEGKHLFNGMWHENDIYANNEACFDKLKKVIETDTVYHDTDYRDAEGRTRKEVEGEA